MSRPPSTPLSRRISEFSVLGNKSGKSELHNIKGISNYNKHKEETNMSPRNKKGRINSLFTSESDKDKLRDLNKSEIKRARFDALMLDINKQLQYKQ